MKNVTIIGMGLMGGALGMTLCRRKREWRVTGVGRRAGSLERARRLGAAHQVTTDGVRAVLEADVVVLALPVDLVVETAKRIRPFLKRECLVMDVGSVKGPIVRGLKKTYSSGPYFVGAHPMAGSEKTGVEHARADLYRNAVCVLTPGRGVPRRTLARAEAFWRGVGGRVMKMSAEGHDRAVAVMSHLPHLMADALMLTAGRRGGGKELFALAAGSFRDATRVAAADPGQWSAIFRMNAGEIRKAAGVFKAALNGMLRGGFPQGPLRQAKMLRDKL